MCDAKIRNLGTIRRTVRGGLPLRVLKQQITERILSGKDTHYSYPHLHVWLWPLRPGVHIMGVLADIGRLRPPAVAKCIKTSLESFKRKYPNSEVYAYTPDTQDGQYYAEAFSAAGLSEGPLIPRGKKQQKYIVFNTQL